MVLDDVLNGELVPVLMFLDEGLVVSQVLGLCDVSPRSVGGNVSSDMFVLLDSFNSRPFLVHGVTLVELDVVDLLRVRPVVVSKDPLNVGSVLGNLVLLDEVRLINDVNVSFDSLEVTDGSSPGSKSILTLVVESSLNLNDSPSLGVDVSLLDDLVVVSVLDNSVTLVNGNVSPVLFDKNSSLDVSDLLWLSLDVHSLVKDSDGDPSISVVQRLDDLAFLTINVSISPSLVNVPLSFTVYDTASLDTSPLFVVDGLDDVLSLNHLNLVSVTEGGVNLNLFGNNDSSWFRPFSIDDFLIGSNVGFDNVVNLYFSSVLDDADLWSRLNVVDSMDSVNNLDLVLGDVSSLDDVTFFSLLDVELLFKVDLDFDLLFDWGSGYLLSDDNLVLGSQSLVVGLDVSSQFRLLVVSSDVSSVDLLV